MISLALTETNLVNSVPTVSVKSEICIYPEPSATILVYDELRGKAAKLKHNFTNSDTSQVKHVITIGPVDKIIDRAKFNLAVSKLCDAFHLTGSTVPVVMASSLPMPPAKAKQSSAVKTDDTFKIFTPSVTGRECSSGSLLYQWKNISAAEISTHLATPGQFSTVLFVPLCRGIPQYYRTTSDGGRFDVLYTEDGFYKLWNSLTHVLLPSKVLLIGIKSSAIGTQKVTSVINTLQPLYEYIETWYHANALNLATTSAYHSEWARRQGDATIIATAVSNMATSTNPVVKSIYQNVQKFICDNATQRRLIITNDAVAHISKLIESCIRRDFESTDKRSKLTALKTAIGSATSTAQSQYVTLENDINTLKKLCPMLEYVGNSHRYDSTQLIKQSCDHIRNYITLATA